MQNAVAQMVNKYHCHSAEDYAQALREIMQEIALLGLWRGKFFEKAAFYGETALRILYGLDRFSEDLDFSLLGPDAAFDLSRYSASLERELAAFGFDVQVEKRNKAIKTAVQSAFIKANTVNQLLVIKTGEKIIRQIPTGQTVKIKIEIDTDPPAGFVTQSKYLLQPIPFSVRSYALPDLFAGKMHALLCRRWKNRVKGRDWYDLVWYCSHHPRLHLAHLAERMRQSGHWDQGENLSAALFEERLQQCIAATDLVQAKQDVLPFVRNPQALDVWSADFFTELVKRIEIC